MNNFFIYNDEWKQRYLTRDILSRDWEMFIDEVKTRGVGRDIYYFPCFREEFCDKVVKMANDLNLWGKMGHESYRTNDTWLRNIGLDDVYNEFIDEYIVDLVEYAYKTADNMNEKGLSKEYQFAQGNVESDTVMTENFIVKYIPETENDSLSCHCDDSTYSCQVSLNNASEYTGGGTWYTKQETLLKPPKGYMNVHPGSLGFRHGARRVYSGNRYTLVSFIRQDIDWEKIERIKEEVRYAEQKQSKGQSTGEIGRKPSKRSGT